MPPVAKKTAASSNNYGTTKRNVRKSGKTRKRRPDSSDSDDSTSSVQQSIGNVYDSDNLDDDSPASGHKRRTSTKIRSPRKKRKVLDVEDEYELEEGQELVGVVVQAPKTGLVPPGQISSNTFEFLTKLKDVKCNNRTWWVVQAKFFPSSLIFSPNRFKLNGESTMLCLGFSVCF